MIALKKKKEKAAMAKIARLPACSVRSSRLACWPFRKLLSFHYLSPDAQQPQAFAHLFEDAAFWYRRWSYLKLFARVCWALLLLTLWHQVLCWGQDIKVREMGRQTLSSGCLVKIQKG